MIFEVSRVKKAWILICCILLKHSIKSSLSVKTIILHEPDKGMCGATLHTQVPTDLIKSKNAIIKMRHSHSVQKHLTWKGFDNNDEIYQWLGSLFALAGRRVVHSPVAADHLWRFSPNLCQQMYCIQATCYFMNALALMAGCGEFTFIYRTSHRIQ